MRTLILSLLIMTSFTLLAQTAEPEKNKRSVQAVALFNGKAMISIDGKKAKIIAAGKSLGRVKLISSTTEEAVIEVSGKRQRLTTNGTVVLAESLASEPVATDTGEAQLWSDSRGFFRSRGSINGSSLSFLVDTGANLVVLNSRDAERVNLGYKDGKLSYAATASGTTQMYLVNLDRISFEGIELYNIQAGVIEGDFPLEPLLGMSFLNRLEMNREGNKMTLKKRF